MDDKLDSIAYCFFRVYDIDRIGCPFGFKKEMRVVVSVNIANKVKDVVNYVFSHIYHLYES